MPATAIPTNLHSAILEKAGEGKGTRVIAEWLKEEHDIAANFTTVARLLNKLRAERSDIAKVVVREYLAPSLTNDLQYLEKLRQRIDERICGNPDDKTLCKLAAEARKIIETKLKYSGADDDDKAKTRPDDDPLVQIVKAMTHDDMEALVADHMRLVQTPGGR